MFLRMCVGAPEIYVTYEICVRICPGIHLRRQYIFIFFLLNFPRDHCDFIRRITTTSRSYLLFIKVKAHGYILASNRDRSFDLNQRRYATSRTASGTDEEYESEAGTRKSAYGRYLIVLSVFTSVISAYKLWKERRP